MASALAFSATASSSFCGKKLAAKSSCKTQTRSVKLTVPKAKYGDESIYFDLKDIENTTGAWDIYGSDGPSPYNGFQAKFFETFAGAFTKRGVLLKILVLGGAGTLNHIAANSTGDILPIKKGPQAPPALGPRGKL